jgi:hypothetical protein
MHARSTCAVAVAAATLAAAGLAAAEGFTRIKVELTGRQEVPAVSTPARGELRATVYRDNSAVLYELSYSGLEGTATQAHIHFGQHSVNGGVAVWLCSNLASPPTPAGVQPCPAQAGTVSGTITPAHVVGPAGQGIAPGEFAEFLEALRDGLTYVNVHSTLVPSGEIRSQIAHGRSRHEH